MTHFNTLHLASDLRINTAASATATVAIAATTDSIFRFLKANSKHTIVTHFLSSLILSQRWLTTRCHFHIAGFAGISFVAK